MIKDDAKREINRVFKEWRRREYPAKEPLTAGSLLVFCNWLQEKHPELREFSSKVEKDKQIILWLKADHENNIAP